MQAVLSGTACFFISCLYKALDLKILKKLLDN